MKKIVALSLLGVAFLAGLAYAETAMEDLDDVYQDTAAFDGGDGSTINTSPAEYDEE